MSKSDPPVDQKGFRGFDSLLSAADAEETRVFDVRSIKNGTDNKDRENKDSESVANRDYSYLISSRSPLSFFSKTKESMGRLGYVKWILFIALVLVGSGIWLFSTGEIENLIGGHPAAGPPVKQPVHQASSKAVEKPKKVKTVTTSGKVKTESGKGNTESAGSVKQYISGTQRALQSRDSAALRSISQQWIKSQPTDDIPWNYLGIAYYLAGKYSKSVAAFQRALSLAPNEKTIAANLDKAKQALAKMGLRSPADDTNQQQSVSDGRRSVALLLSQKQLVRQIQKDLKQLHYDAGPVDGIYGKQTEQAVRKYQGSVGLKPDGQVTESLLKRLDKAVNSDRSE